MPAPDPIELLLAGRYPDPETGQMLAAESQSVVIEDSLDGAECELVEQLGVGRHLALLADTSTYEALGRRVERALAGQFRVQTIILPAGPAADAETVARLVAAVDSRTDAVISVGSGTLNDLGKMVGFQRSCPHVVFATAPSMNGYTSLSASITTDGMKRSYRTKTAAGVFFDLRVLSRAPARLIRAGLGDSLCRSTAQADWLLSHLLLDRPYREAPFALLADDEHALVGQTDALIAGELDAMRHLVRTLVLSGFGMTICNGSYPASQGEHLLSHYVEMMHPPGVPMAFHGEQIAVCTVAMARLQDRMLASDAPPRLHASRVTHADVMRHFGPVMGEACWQELELKRFDEEETERLNARLAARWDEMRARIGAISHGAVTLCKLLAAAGAPLEPAALRWPMPLFEAALTHAREIRNRYTFLDLDADSR